MHWHSPIDAEVFHVGALVKSTTISVNGGQLRTGIAQPGAMGTVTLQEVP